MENFKLFRKWGAIGGKRTQARRLLKAKIRRQDQHPRRKPGRKIGTKNIAVAARDGKMIALFRDKNKTMEEIGIIFEISRARVQQILYRNGLSAQDGGSYQRTLGINAKTEKDRAIRREEKMQKLFGCSVAEYELLTGSRKIGVRGGGNAARYRQQSRFAAARGIVWNITFPEWMSVWEESGMLGLRGRGQGAYVMSRNGDIGAYEIGNVSIRRSIDNNSDTSNKKSGLPMGVTRAGIKYVASKMIGGLSYHVGTFDTAELAHAVYVTFQPSDAQRAIAAKRKAKQ